MQCRGVKSFVDDLVLGRGVVLSRAATSLRSIETKPFDYRFVRSRRASLRSWASSWSLDGRGAGSSALGWKQSPAQSGDLLYGSRVVRRRRAAKFLASGREKTGSGLACWKVANHQSVVVGKSEVDGWGSSDLEKKQAKEASKPELGLRKKLRLRKKFGLRKNSNQSPEKKSLAEES